jgi:hypothetical protein
VLDVVPCDDRLPHVLADLIRAREPHTVQHRLQEETSHGLCQSI